MRRVKKADVGPKRDPRFEAMVVKLMAFCKANGVTAHTYHGNGPHLVFKRKMKA